MTTISGNGRDTSATLEQYCAWELKLWGAMSQAIGIAEMDRCTKLFR